MMDRSVSVILSYYYIILLTLYYIVISYYYYYNVAVRTTTQHRPIVAVSSVGPGRLVYEKLIMLAVHGGQDDGCDVSVVRANDHTSSRTLLVARACVL